MAHVINLFSQPLCVSFIIDIIKHLVYYVIKNHIAEHCVKNIIKRKKNLRYKPKKMQLLLHAGGSSSYKYIKDFKLNKKNQLLGRITIDDILDLMKEEAEKDYQLASGIASDVEADDTIFQLTKARLPWLFLGLLGGLGSVFILKDYEIIMSKPELRNLFFYTPLIAAMAGNVGVQSSAIIVQGLANDVVKGSLFSRLVKEIGLSLINGLALSAILVLFGAIINQDYIISFTIAGSMMAVIIVAALVGTFIPIILNQRGINPAIATGPFITTCNDIFGIFLFFYIAQLTLGF